MITDLGGFQVVYPKALDTLRGLSTSIVQKLSPLSTSTSALNLTSIQELYRQIYGQAASSFGKKLVRTLFTDSNGNIPPSVASRTQLQGYLRKNSSTEDATNDFALRANNNDGGFRFVR
jgi:hypothetical protein